MQKLSALLLSLVFCGAAFGSVSIPLSITNGGLITHNNGTVDVNLSPLFLNMPYEIDCTVGDTGFPNKVVFGVIYPQNPDVNATYLMNNIPFTRLVEIKNSTNTFVADNIENTTPTNSVLTFANLDLTYDIQVTACSAKPIVGLAKAKNLN